jgi:alpha-beta hydrolase superfamily lysophospholipase
MRGSGAMLANVAKGLLGIVLCMAVISALIILLQSKLLYLPHRYSTGDLIGAAERYQLRLWPTPGKGYLGLVSSASTGARGTVVVFHGNAGSALNRLHYIDALEPLGYRVVLAEYPGYGFRGGRLREDSLVADGKTTVQKAAQEFGRPVYVWGESLGCGVATAVAADPSLMVEGLALLTPFTNLPDLAQAVYWNLPISLLIRDQYDSVANLANYEKPVALLVAERDELMPREQAEELYAGLKGRKRMWIFAGAGHNTWPAGAAEPWWREVAGFLASE